MTACFQRASLALPSSRPHWREGGAHFSRLVKALSARRWTIVIALAALAIHFTPVDCSWLALSREALAHGRLWTLLTGSLVHVSDVHVWMDVLGLLLVGCIFEPRFGRAWPWLIAFINVVVSLGVLALYPHLPGYCGLSALDQGLLASGCVGLLVDKHHAAAALIGGVLIAKWAFEIAGGLPLMGAVSDDPLLYGQPVPWAHAIGGITGAIGTVVVKLRGPAAGRRLPDVKDANTAA